ncbi:hypothetical protein [Nitratireductor sp. GCM10026969]|uniref:hypothetical protein n=1 Tax=Nitratireductor sp. GCM10026969 TaxID=3252645 RepID=UPI00361D280E
MPASPLIDKTIILRLLDELAELGLCEEDMDMTLVRDGPVDLDLLEECKREHPYFKGSRIMHEIPVADENCIRPAFWIR